MSFQPRQNDRVITERPWQTAAREHEKRWNVLIWHRRCGKTYHLVLRMLTRMVHSGKRDWQGAYVAPTRLQASQIAAPYLQAFAEPLKAEFNKSELKLTVPGCGFIQLFSGENYDRMRGLYLDDVTIDEAAHVPSAAWSQVISPALADRQGGCTFAGTPNGYANLLYEMYEHATTADDPDWQHSLLTVKDTTALEPREVDRMRRIMLEEEFDQEMMCSFAGAVRGAYYSKDLALMMKQNRVTTVDPEDGHPVQVALDLGWNDLMVAIFFQEVGTQIRILRCDAYDHTPIPDMIRQWELKPDLVILPHDARVSELGTGKTREFYFHDMGLETYIVPNQPIHEGISAVRHLFPHIWMNEATTKTLREALQSYRSAYDEVRRVHSMKPEHSWASHYADALRYLALGRGNQPGAWAPYEPSNFGVYA